MSTTTVTSKIWHGTVPIEFSLDVQELTAANVTVRSEPCFMLVRRCSYLAMLTGQLRQLLVERKLPFIGDDSDIWYSDAGQPLRWHYPVGLLYDLSNATDRGAGEEPWRVTLHTQSYPKDSLKLPPPSLSATRDMYMSMIKESDFARHGSAKKVMRLPKQEQQQLWSCLDSGDYQGFWTVNRLLVGGEDTDEALSSDLLGADQGDLRQVPVRLYILGCPILQDAVSVSDDSDSKPRCLRDMLQDLLPLLFPRTGTAVHDGRALDSALQGVEFAEAILHGVPLPLDTPLAWAARHLAYADNFLHIVVRSVSKNDVPPMAQPLGPV